MSKQPKDSPSKREQRKLTEKTNTVDCLKIIHEHKGSVEEKLISLVEEAYFAGHDAGSHMEPEDFSYFQEKIKEITGKEVHYEKDN